MFLKSAEAAHPRLGGRTDTCRKEITVVEPSVAALECKEWQEQNGTEQKIGSSSTSHRKPGPARHPTMRDGFVPQHFLSVEPVTGRS
jgi:hypothetical protein